MSIWMVFFIYIIVGFVIASRYVWVLGKDNSEIPTSGEIIFTIFLWPLFLLIIIYFALEEKHGNKIKNFLYKISLERFFVWLYNKGKNG